jgi:hypothetical protein
LLGIVDLDSDHGVRADHRALAALNADVGIPHGKFEREISFFPFGGAGREGAVDREGADREVRRRDFRRLRREHFVRTRALRWRRVRRSPVVLRDGRELLLRVKVGQRFIDGLHIFLDDVFALAAVGVANGFANGFDRLVAAAELWRWRRSRPAGWYSCGCPCRCRARRCRRR